MRSVKWSEANTKTVVIVTGRAGERQERDRAVDPRGVVPAGRAAIHATGSSAFTGTMRKVAGHRDKRAGTV